MVSIARLYQPSLQLLVALDTDARFRQFYDLIPDTLAFACGIGSWTLQCGVWLNRMLFTTAVSLTDKLAQCGQQSDFLRDLQRLDHNPNEEVFVNCSTDF